MTEQSSRVEPKRVEPKKSIASRLYTGDISIDFVGLRRRWYVMSGIILTVAVLALLIRGLSLGIEFSGGADFQAPTQVTSQSVEQMRSALEDSGIPDLDDATITTLGDNTIRVQTRSLDPETEVPLMREVIADELGISSDEVAYSLIGASWGRQVTQQGIIALAVFLVLVMLLIWVYFRDLKMSIAAMAALLHDLVLTIGIYALVGLTFTPATLIGMLTILGYSLYDTVVVFDKVRENVDDLESRPYTYATAANNATNQVLIRSINTTIIGVLPVAALLIAGWLVLGTGPLQDLGLVLFVGMVAGAYSSVLIATPLLVDLKNREPAIQAHNRRIARREERTESERDASTGLDGSTVFSGDDDFVDEDAEETRKPESIAARITTASAQPWPAADRPSDPAGSRVPPTGRRQPHHQPRSERKK